MPLNNSYQVKEQDRDLLTLAERLGMDYQAVKKLNPSITSISQGQFINLPPTTPADESFKLNYFTPQPGGAGSFLGGGNTIANTNLQTYTPSPSGPVYGGTGTPPPGYGPNAGVPPQTPGPQSVYGPNSFFAGGQNQTGQLERVYYLKNQLANATDPSQMPGMIRASDVMAAGFTPAQMLQAGYTFQNGQWINPKSTAAAGAASAAGGTGGGEIAPENYRIVWNRNAKNPRNRFVTNLKWARNQWRRQKKRAKGHFRTEPAVEIRADTPSTTLDLILGT